MADVTVDTYENGDLVATRTEQVPESPHAAAEREFRAAVEGATSIAGLKEALLGTSGPGAQPRSA